MERERNISGVHASITEAQKLILKACLHEGWGPQVGEVTCLGPMSPKITLQKDNEKKIERARRKKGGDAKK